MRAGDGNRTRVIGLGSRSFTIKLRPHVTAGRQASTQVRPSADLPSTATRTSLQLLTSAIVEGTAAVESTSACSKWVCSELDQCICILKQSVQRSRRTTPLRHGRHVRHYRVPDRFLGATNALRFGACPKSLVAHSSRLITSSKFSRTIRYPSSNSLLY